MAASLHLLHPQTPAIARFLRVGTPAMRSSLAYMPRDALADLHAEGPHGARSHSPGFRGGARTINAAMGR